IAPHAYHPCFCTHRRPGIPHRFTPSRLATADHPRPRGAGQQQHVCGVGGAARRAGRVRCGPRGCVAALHADDGVPGAGRAVDGADGGPPWADAGAVRGGGGGVWRLCVGGAVGQHLDLWAGAWVDGAGGQLGHVCAVDGRHGAVVEPAARHCGGDLRQRQLHCRCAVATHRAARHRSHWLAPDLCADGAGVWGGHAAVGAAHAPAGADGVDGCGCVCGACVVVTFGRGCCVGCFCFTSDCVRTFGSLGTGPQPPVWLSPRARAGAAVGGGGGGAEMLSLMLACGIVSRLVSGVICDRIGGVRTLLLGSALQGVGLMLFLPFDGLVPLYVISAMFGLFQGGIVPAYAIIIREYFAPQEAGARVGAVIMATLIGMALGGWMSGWIFDVTGSYQAAFINGMGWNLLNLSIMGWLYWRVRRQGAVEGRVQPSAG